MSIPRKHHFLPRWFLDRWALDGVLWEFTRQGPGKLLKAKYRRPSETGYQEHLYTIPGFPAKQAASIETEFLQLIDGRGAQAVKMAESGIQAGPDEKSALVQFILSMIHRTPDSIKRLENRLKDDLHWRPEFSDSDGAIYREGALNVFADLVQSDLMLARLSSLSTFFIDLGPRGHDLLTCDCPILLSNGLGHSDAFVILTTGPRRLLVLSEKRSIVDYLAGQDARVLSSAINEALVVQACEIVISTSPKALRFIDKRFGNEALKAKHPFEPKTGLVRWTL